MGLLRALGIPALILGTVAGLGLGGWGCSGKPVFHQPGHDVEKIYSRIYLTDYNTAWGAVLEVLKAHDKIVQNRQGGILQTSWRDNTAEKNFIDSFGGDATYLKARYRFHVSVAPGSYNGKPSVKVSIRKDQMIQRDMLEGWKNMQTDSIEENTFLYRVGRVIFTKLKLEEMERKKMEQIQQEGV